VVDVGLKVNATPRATRESAGPAAGGVSPAGEGDDGLRTRLVPPLIVKDRPEVPRIGAQKFNGPRLMDGRPAHRDGVGADGGCGEGPIGVAAGSVDEGAPDHIGDAIGVGHHRGENHRLPLGDGARVGVEGNNHGPVGIVDPDAQATVVAGLIRTTSWSAGSTAAVGTADLASTIGYTRVTCATSGHKTRACIVAQQCSCTPPQARAGLTVEVGTVT